MLDFVTFIHRIKAEADRLQAEGLGIDEAYVRAHDAILMATAEGEDVSPFEAQLLNTIEQLSQNGRPVRTVRLSAALNGADTWKLWYHLAKLRRRGLVSNQGKSGWLVSA